MWNKKKILSLISACILILMVGCSSSNKETKMTDFLSKLKNDIGYNAEYIEDRKTVRLTDYLTKDVIVKAVSEDSVYSKWIEMKNTILKLYDDVEELADSSGMKGIKYEIVVIDKDSAKAKDEVPLLIVNETGVVFDMVEEVKNNKYD